MHLGKTIVLKGEIVSHEDLVLEGRLDGPVFCEKGSVTLAASARVTGDIIARDITVFGEMTGQLIATEVVDLRADSTVRAQVSAARFILDERAEFFGRVEPQHLEAALRVAKYNQKKRDEGAAT